MILGPTATEAGNATIEHTSQNAMSAGAAPLTQQ
jgi:hypothetical protein